MSRDPGGGSRLRQSTTGRNPLPSAAPILHPMIRCAAVFKALDKACARVDAWIDRALPEHLNPLARTGACANTCLLIAVISGVLLLFWYSPSVHQAYDSLDSLRENSLLGQLMRSLHRYSSDACMLFIVLHMVRVLAATKFTGPRTLAWVTGVFLLGIVWFVGWTGYWLVWDERAQQVALGTARFFEMIPFLGRPLAASFLANDTVPSLLFFLIFFGHMLLPLGIAILLWLHVTRISRPRVFTCRPLTAAIVGALVALSLLFPAGNAGRADLSTQPESFTMDFWYLWPLVLTDRLGSMGLWLVFFGGFIGLCAIPWLLSRRTAETAKAAAVVDADACEGCTLCSKDCPFDAIQMVGRQDAGKGSRFLARVDPDRCLACGICSGACDSDAIATPGFDVGAEKVAATNWIRTRKAQGLPALFAYGCFRSATKSLTSGSDALDTVLEGYRVRNVPCAGWVGASLIEELMERGADGVLMVGCAGGEPIFREGSEWLEARLEGRRKPRIRARRAPPGKLLATRVAAGGASALREIAAEFAVGRRLAEANKRPLWARIIAVCALTVVLCGVTWIGSDLNYKTPDNDPELIVYIHHYGQVLEQAADTASQSTDTRPLHMRPQHAAASERAAVRVQLELDGRVLYDRALRPRGLRREGPSTMLQSLQVPAGTHVVRVRINDSGLDGEWAHEWSGSVTFAENTRQVLSYDASGRGFIWHD